MIKKIDWKNYYNQTEYKIEVDGLNRKEEVICQTMMIPHLIVKMWNSILFAEQPKTSYDDVDLNTFDLRVMSTSLLSIGKIFVVPSILEDESVVDIVEFGKNVNYTLKDGNVIDLEFKKEDLYFRHFIEYEEDKKGEFKPIKYKVTFSKKKTFGTKKKGDIIYESNNLDLMPKMIKLDLFSNFGEPIYSSAVNFINRVNETFNEMHRDMELSVPLVAYPEYMIKTGQANREKENVNKIRYLDVFTRRFRISPASPESKLLPQEFRGDFDPKKYIDKINLELHMISLHSGFGAKYLSYDSNFGFKTATEIISEKDDLFKNKSLIEDILKEVHFYLHYYFSFVKDNEILEYDKFKINFSDNIIIDDNKKQEKYYNDFKNGAISKKTYLELSGYSQEIIEKETQDIVDAQTTEIGFTIGN